MLPRLLLCTLLGLSAPATSFAQEPTSHLDRVLERGLLRVCTTGDYKPYSYLRDDGRYEGIDISLVESLAQSLGVRVKWIDTTWKSLMADFQGQECDIAVGGISVSLERQKKAFFSQPLSVDGKVPLVRCQDLSRYQTLEQINQPSVRLIEPPGGTNEIFARNRLPNANLTLFADNVKIFDQLLAKHADVMITDASEARFQQRHKPGLCAVQPERYLQYSEKAFLLPRDDMAWKSYVDQWLHLTKATGAYDQVVNQWIGDKQ
ncbi:transporter substrate-binding domain-containing protein [Pseudomonas sp. NFXW11]|uniref:transporter substrate-binding domain-containing protein n=1 Tax=Pseudomonas sp. NFXW11 TaxID=2819531 RepID=UPI003CFB1804